MVSRYKHTRSSGTYSFPLSPNTGSHTAHMRQGGTHEWRTHSLRLGCARPQRTVHRVALSRVQLCHYFGEGRCKGSTAHVACQVVWGTNKSSLCPRVHGASHPLPVNTCENFDSKPFSARPSTRASNWGPGWAETKCDNPTGQCANKAPFGRAFKDISTPLAVASMVGKLHRVQRTHIKPKQL